MIEPINTWDLPDTIQVRDGWDMEYVPDLTRDNMEYIIEKHNELVEAFNQMNGDNHD